jgi:hypothetical protein
MLDEGIHLLEAALIHKLLDALTCGQLALLVLAFDLVTPSALAVGGKALFQALNDLAAHRFLLRFQAFYRDPRMHRPASGICGYHGPVQQPSNPEPPVDPRWLEALAEALERSSGAGGRPVDLYLEQRLELCAVQRDGVFRIESCRSEGAAARWQSPARVLLHAGTGLSTRAIGGLLRDRLTVPVIRTVPPAEMDAPRGWIEWARTVTARLAPSAVTIRHLQRRAAVVRPGQWTIVGTPALVRVELDGPVRGALLAVWRHPQLGEWLTELARPAPKKRWQPPSGLTAPVILSAGTAGVVMHEILGHMAESDLVVDGTSPLADLLGATLTEAGLHIVDDPTRFDLPGAFDHDDEGATGRPLDLIHDGRLERFLCDRAGATRIGGEPGRGRRAGWNRPPVARLSNLVVAGGITPPQDLEEDLDHGLLVSRLGNATVDPTSNRVVLRVERGWEIRNGRRRRPLADCELTGGILETLAAIDPHVGSDPTPDWRLGWCIKDGMPIATGSEAPTVAIRRLEVL